MKKKLIETIGSFKAEMNFTGSWISVLMLAVTTSSSLYAINLLDIQSLFPSPELFFVITLIIFPLFCKGFTKMLVVTNIYATERNRAINLDVFMVDQLTPKEKNFFVPMNCDMAQNQIDILNVLLMLLKDNKDSEAISIVKKNRDQLQKTLGSYRGLLENDI